MKTALPLDADTTRESATSPFQTDELSDLDLNLNLDGNDPQLSEITIPHVSPPDATKTEVPSRPIPLSSEIQPDPKNSHSLVTPLAGTTLQQLDPQRIRIGDMPNRSPEAFTGETFKSLCQSMVALGGNTQPIQVRLLAPTEMSHTAGASYELVSGERRLRAAVANGQQILAMVFEGPLNSGAELLTITENLSREDLTPYEWGRQLMHVTKQKPGYSMSRLAQLSGRDKSMVSRAMELASLPTQIVDAFTSVRDLRYADAKPLLAAYEKDRDNVLVEADLIKHEAENLKGPEVVKRLVAAASGAVAQCNTPEPIAIKFENRVVGELSTTKNGGSQILINIEISDQQRMALVEHLEHFVSRRVLRTSTSGGGKVKTKTLKKMQTHTPKAPVFPSVFIDAAGNDA